MTVNEFVKICSNSGYCSAETAKRYANGKEELSCADFQNVFRLSQLETPRMMRPGNQKFRPIRENGRTTKHYTMDYSDRLDGEGRLNDEIYR